MIRPWLAIVFGLCLVFTPSFQLMAQDDAAQGDAAQEESAQDDGDASTGEATDDDLWLTDMAKAKELATAEGKDLLVNFTGSDWCVWCIKLEEEVFDKSEFKDSIADRFVLVKLDFPRDKSGIPEETQKQNDEWKLKLEVGGFPSIFLLDNEGRPFAKTGYQEGGPEPYLTHLDGLREVRVKRDDLLAKAADAEGQAKAKLIDEALTLIDEGLVTTHYESLIKEIVELDSEDEAGLRTKYFAAQDAEARKRILSRIALAAQTQSPALAIKIIDDALGEMKMPPEMKVEALQTKLRLLRAYGNQLGVTALLDEMIELEGIPNATRQKLVVQKIYAMVGAGQHDESLELLDEMIASSIDNLYLCVAKGELLDRLGKHEMSLEAYDEAIKGAVNDPDLATEIYISKSDVLASLGKFEDAYAMLDRIVANPKTPQYLKPDLLIQKALLLRETGDTEKAELAEYQAVDLTESPEERADLLKLIEQIRKDGGN